MFVNNPMKIIIFSCKRLFKDSLNKIIRQSCDFIIKHIKNEPTNKIYYRNFKRCQ